MLSKNSAVGYGRGYGSARFFENESQGDEKTSNNTRQTIEFIPMDLEKEMELAMNEPLPDALPFDENSSDLVPLEELSVDNSLNSLKENSKKEIANISSSLQVHSSNFKSATFPIMTPGRKLNVVEHSNELKDEIEHVTKAIDTNLDLGIAALPFKTPIRDTKLGKENFLNPQPKPRQHLIRHQHNNLHSSLRATSLKSSSKLLATPMGVDKFDSNFRTPTHSHSWRPVESVSTTKVALGKTANKQFTKIRVNGIEYINLKTLGRGGSSVVYQCFDLAAMENRAIKSVVLESPQSSEGYVKEIEVLRRLQHCDRIIRIYDYELLTHEKKLYVVLEMGSADLAQILRQLSREEKTLPSYLILFYWMEMLYAVQQIHSHGIIHSDLKPANFLQVNGRLKLIDFGISSCVQNDCTSVIKDNSEGSTNYISPEALNDIGSNKASPNCGKPKYKISYKADVWSLGCILYQLIYKKTPFQHITNTMQKLLAIANSSVKIDYPQEVKIPEKFRETVKKCLEFNARSRPSVDELISEYEEFCKI